MGAVQRCQRMVACRGSTWSRSHRRHGSPIGNEGAGGVVGPPPALAAFGVAVPTHAPVAAASVVLPNWRSQAGPATENHPPAFRRRRETTHSWSVWFSFETGVLRACALVTAGGEDHQTPIGRHGGSRAKLHFNGTFGLSLRYQPEMSTTAALVLYSSMKSSNSP